MAEPRPIVLAVEGVSYSYLDRYPALDDVTVDVVEGERVALLGPNGGGKSTLLKILAGLVFPEAGVVRAFGAVVTEASLEDRQFNEGFRSRVGFVFQDTDAQLFSPTVRDELAFGPLNLGLERAEVARRVDDLLELFGLAGLADRAPYQLSEGQKKRVAVASVLVMNPEVLLLDEPTAGLDPGTQNWFLSLLGELSAAGKTIVVATHDRYAIERLQARPVMLDEDHHVTPTPDASNGRIGPAWQVPPSMGLH